MIHDRTWFAKVAAFLCLAVGAQVPAYAQQSASGGPAVPDLQRSYQIDHYRELATGGPARGENLYFYKCFICHNHFAQGGPQLQGLFKRSQLAAGGPVTDQTVAAFIRGGSAAMPGFGHTLEDVDVRDLVAYLRSPECCYEANDPPVNPQYQAATRRWSVPTGVHGGPRGSVRGQDGLPLEGIKVQLIAPNGTRTTVFTDEAGAYEFPALQTGDYLLRIATPVSYVPYERNPTHVSGNARLPDIVLERLAPVAGISVPGALPATPEVASQLSGAELLWNLPGSNFEKTAFVRTCGIGCHDLKEILRNRFDERGWQITTAWMTSRGSGSAFVIRPPVSTFSPEVDVVMKWLTRVRGPGSKDDAYRPFPRPVGTSTKAVVTEYELPRRFTSVHQVAGDSKGRIWFTSHRTPYIGALDPRTGIVTEYRVPDIEGAFPGTFKVAVDRKDIIWISQNWAHRLVRFDPATGEFRQMLVESKTPINGGGLGNFGLAPDGFVWSEHDNNTIVKIDPQSGSIVQRFPLTRNGNPPDNMVSGDGRFWAGGSAGMGSNTAMILDIRSGRMYETNSGEIPTSAARGGFDRKNNVWMGGHMGAIVEIVNGIDAGHDIQIRAFTPPTPAFPYTQFYGGMTDKNDDVWVGWLHGPGYVRYSPGSGAWHVYDNAEPSAFGRNTWVDNTTTPVSVWYADYQMGTLVRIQPRD